MSAGHSPGRIVLVRHGETEWSRDGKHTGRTDLPLTDKGEADARALAERLTAYDFRMVLASPLARAQRTAELAGLTPETDADLMEWDYGDAEGRTTTEIREERDHPWDVFVDGVGPGETPGETVEEVAARASRVIARVQPVLDDGDVALVGHGHMLRILTATFLQQPPRFGAGLYLDAGALCVLQHYREHPAIKLWNG